MTKQSVNNPLRFLSSEKIPQCLGNEIATPFGPAMTMCQLSMF